MALQATFVVQTFELKRKRLVPGALEVSTIGSGALTKAQAIAGSMPGAAALKIVADDETGELESATIPGSFGDAPEEVADSLAGG